jgi:SpoVK/Ycf46/Vps4 family AAA+-type ATPase
MQPATQTLQQEYESLQARLETINIEIETLTPGLQKASNQLERLVQSCFNRIPLTHLTTKASLITTALTAPAIYFAYTLQANAGFAALGAFVLFAASRGRLVLKTKKELQRKKPEIDATVSGSRLVTFHDFDASQEFPFQGVAMASHTEEVQFSPVSWRLEMKRERAIDALFILLTFPQTEPLLLVETTALRKPFFLYRTEFTTIPHELHALFQSRFVKRCGSLRKHRKTVKKYSQLQRNRIELAAKTAEVKELLEQQDQGGYWWGNIVVQPELKTRLVSALSVFAQGKARGALGLLLSGPPGTGKTTMAQTVGKNLRLNFKAVTPSDLIGNVIGESEKRVREVWNEARLLAPCVLFVDECEGVFNRRGGVDANSFSDGIVRSFLSEWDGVHSTGGVFVIGATNNRSQIDDAILSRFSDSIEIPLPNTEVRNVFLAERLGISNTESASLLNFLVETSLGFSFRDLNRLCDQLLQLHQSGQELNQQTISQLVSQIRGGGAAVATKRSSWDELVLSEEIIQELKVTIALLSKAEAYRAKGVSIPKAVLLYGAPGTGKTHIARTLAHEAGLGYFFKTTADLRGKYIGHSAALVKSAFEQARSSSPSILCIDELEALVPKRTESGGVASYASELTTQLLQEMEGLQQYTEDVFVVGITNHPELIDDAILSRFKKRIEIPLPSSEQRLRLLEVFLRGKPLQLTQHHLLLLLAKAAEGLSGRDLRGLVEDIESRAVSRSVLNGNPDSLAITDEDVLAILGKRFGIVTP